MDGEDTPTVQTPTDYSREYYGIVLYISTLVLLPAYAVYALVPDSILTLAVKWYPPKHMAVAVPLFVVFLVPFVVVVFAAKCLEMRTDPTSYRVVCDEATSWYPVDARVGQTDMIMRVQDVDPCVVNQCWVFED